MRSSLIIMLMVTVLFSGGYFYYVAQAVCPIPLEYSIGTIDDSFNLSYDEAKLAMAEAESVWEDATGQNLFTYNEDARFTINFLYDDRQATTDAEGDFKDKLDQGKQATESVNARYQVLVEEYDELQVMYSAQADRYRKDIAAYNAQVEALNAQGGAGQEQYALLQERKEELDIEQEELDVLSTKLNQLVEDINKVSDQGNQLIETYNRGVYEYNNTFGVSREFTQGTYSTAGEINIYAFENQTELRLVLAHELGHALSLDHVANEESIMYFLIGAQPDGLTPTNKDITEFSRVCAQWSVWDTIKQRLNI